VGLKPTITTTRDGGESVAQQLSLLTAEEFFRLYSHKEGHYELVKGEVVEMAPPGGVHGGITSNIGYFFQAYNRQHHLGRVVVEAGFRLESQPDTVRGPDVAFILNERVPPGGLPRAFFVGAPDLAVEVVSPSDTAAELERKVHEYLNSGAQRVWVVYPDTRRVAVHQPDGMARWYSEEETLEDPELLPGLSLPIREIFA
jgi:Uma2 family endonuclease